MSRQEEEFDDITPYTEILCANNERIDVKKSSLCWLLRPDYNKLSSDKLLRVRSSSAPNKCQKKNKQTFQFWLNCCIQRTLENHAFNVNLTKFVDIIGIKPIKNISACSFDSIIIINRQINSKNCCWSKLDSYIFISVLIFHIQIWLLKFSWVVFIYFQWIKNLIINYSNYDYLFLFTFDFFSFHN